MGQFEGKRFTQSLTNRLAASKRIRKLKPWLKVKGKPQSAEHRAKRSEAMKGYYARMLSQKKELNGNG